MKVKAKYEKCKISVPEGLNDNRIFQGCLFHERNTCPDCMFAQLCGDNQKTNECNFMKVSELSQRVQQNTAEIIG